MIKGSGQIRKLCYCCHDDEEHSRYIMPTGLLFTRIVNGMFKQIAIGTVKYMLYVCDCKEIWQNIHQVRDVQSLPLNISIILASKLLSRDVFSWLFFMLITDLSLEACLLLASCFAWCSTNVFIALTRKWTFTSLCKSFSHSYGNSVVCDLTSTRMMLLVMKYASTPCSKKC